MRVDADLSSQRRQLLVPAAVRNIVAGFLLMRMLLFVAAVVGVCGISLAAQTDGRIDSALKTSQSVIGTAVPDFTFLDAGSKSVRFSQFRGKPLLVNLIYTSCSDVCPTVIESLAPAANAAAGVVGEDRFNVLTIGFDTRRDTPARMQSFAKAHGAGGDNWYFLVADAGTVDRFTAVVGFDYFSTAGGFDHMAQITVIDKDGRIYDQVYGSTFDPPTIVEPLKRLILGGEKPVFSLAGLADRVKLLCTIYDSRKGRYYFNYSIFISIFIGAVCLGGVFFFLINEARKAFQTGES